MLDGVIEAIEEWMRKLLTGMIVENMGSMYEDVNAKVGLIAGAVGQTPQGWNASIYSMVRNLSDTVIMPIAGTIIAYVLCYELISMIMEKNSMYDIETWMIFRFVMKAGIAVYLVGHTLDITLAIFEVGQHVVSSASSAIGGSTDINPALLTADLESKMEGMEIPELIALVIESSLVGLSMQIVAILILVILYVRMVEIYLYISIAPIPFATLTNREWGQIGTGYLRGLIALAFQGFFIMICVGIYAVLVASIQSSANIHSALFGLAGYTLILCFSLLKTGSLSKAIFHAM